MHVLCLMSSMHVCKFYKCFIFGDFDGDMYLPGVLLFHTVYKLIKLMFYYSTA